MALFFRLNESFSRYSSFFYSNKFSNAQNNAIHPTKSTYLIWWTHLCSHSLIFCVQKFISFINGGNNERNVKWRIQTNEAVTLTIFWTLTTSLNCIDGFYLTRSQMYKYVFFWEWMSLIIICFNTANTNSIRWHQTNSVITHILFQVTT